MEPIVSKFTVVREVNSTPTKAVIIATGGGTGIFPLLLERGGGSSTLLSGMIPYVQEETIGILKGKPDKFVSEQTARSLAMAAYQKAVTLCKDGSPVIGLACTASLQTIPAVEERVGRVHKIFLAMQTAWKTVAVTYEMIQHDPQAEGGDVDHRLWEEERCIVGLLNLLAEGCGTEHYVSDDLPNIKVVRKEVESGIFGDLLAKRTNVATFPSLKTPEPARIIFPGSFNPVHEAHMEMVSLIRNNPKMKPESKTIAFEISMFNVDKPPLDFITLQERVDQFTKMDETVHITAAPTFIEKSAIFKDCCFIVGYDTAVRILDPRYAGPIENVLKTFKENGTYFYIFPRQSLESFALPGEYITDKREFEHVSSSAIRKEGSH